jgi:dipeptidyl aminopeptidase/acylaminoacyl peptidase
MKRKILFLFTLLALAGSAAWAQENLGYQKPPQEILELVEAPLAPTVSVDDAAENMLLLYRDAYQTITELSEPELRLGGLRINPQTNIGSRTTYFNNLKLKRTSLNDEARQVTDLPQNPRLSNISWSPSQQKVAFTHTTEKGVELWMLDVAAAQARRLTEARVNANMGTPYTWFKDGSALLVRMLPTDRQSLINTTEATPEGPTVSVSSGEKAQNRTYQDLLKNPNDEANFEQLARSEIFKVSLEGQAQRWLPAALYSSLDFSPDGRYVLVNTIERPFSYLVPYYRFPNLSKVYDLSGKLVTTVNEVPLDEVRPKGFMATREGRRSMNWRADQPATLYWAEALDKGDPEVEVEYRDVVYQLPAPFTGQPQELLKTLNRYSYIQWGDAQHAIAHDSWWNNRNTKSYLFNPSQPAQQPKVISDRNYQDVYSDPGNFVTTRNTYHESVLDINGGKVYLLGAGFSEKGQFPFVDELDLATLKTKRLYQSPYTDKLESLQEGLDMKKGTVLVRLESPQEYPNYYIRNIKKKNALTPITNFENPFKSLQNVHKEVITYKRPDGLELDATLYLPVGYDREKKEKMPMIMWAYPREFKDKASAGQNTSNPNEFIYPYYGSPVYWVTRGYVVLDGAAFPIVGEGETEPNDSFREQLVANAKAAIDAVDDMGYIDRSRVGVGGHSYGAFMVANLLSHSDLFAAGIARSGAYNRTLTPFGFQSEERSYWDAPDVYNSMSPFMHADKMDEPLLLIHGEADNNSGTYPLQSERYFNALKGLGATARLVMLPKESHGYRAKESILHLLWEQDQWLEKYVKNRELSGLRD